MGVMKMAEFAVVTHCFDSSAAYRALSHQSFERGEGWRRLDRGMTGA